MITDDKGFILSTRSHRPGRQFTAIRATELKALDRSTNPSLRALAKRIHQALEEGMTHRNKEDEKAAWIKRSMEERRRDPVKVAEDKERQRALAHLLMRSGGFSR